MLALKPLEKAGSGIKYIQLGRYTKPRSQWSFGFWPLFFDVDDVANSSQKYQSVTIDCSTVF